MSTLQLTSREEINEFLKAGHEQYVSTSERFEIIEEILIRKREHELDLSELDLSDKRRAVKTETISNNTTKKPRRYFVKKPAVLRRCGFLDQRQRLTSRLDTIISKPQMKLGIFNHFCKSKSIRMRTFDEAEIAKDEDVRAVEFKPIAVREKDHLDSENSETLLAVQAINIRSLDPIESPLCELSEIESAQDCQHNQEDTRVENCDNNSMLTLCFDIAFSSFGPSTAMLGSCNLDDELDEFSSASSCSVPTSFLDRLFCVMAPPKAPSAQGSTKNSDLQDILANMAQLAMGTEKRTGQPAPKVDPAQIRSMHAQAYRNSKDERHAHASHYASRQTFCGDIYCSKMPLEQLTRIGIKNLKMELKHEGKFLLLRLVEPCFKMSGIMTVVEDPEGAVSILSLYNYIEKDSVDVEQLLPVGTIIALKEPHYKFTNTNSCVIRCDSPSDIIILHRTGRDNGLDLANLVFAEKCLSGVTWKTKLASPSVSTLDKVTLENSVEEQHRAYTEGRLHDVVGISAKMCHKYPHDHVRAGLAPYRSLACLDLGYLENAAADMIWLAPCCTHDPMTYLIPIGRAMYRLRRYEDALRVYMQLVKLFPDGDVQFMNGYEASKKRVLEAKEGRYDLGEMMAMASKNPRLDHADYSGPVRLVPLTNPRGFKVVVSKAVEPGTLLLASKAFEIVYQSELKDAASAFMLINFKNNIISLPARSQLVTKIALRILENPSTALGLYDLETRDSPSTVNGPVKLYADDINQREPIADVDLIHRIVAHNALNPESLDENMLGYKKQSSEKASEPDAGLWILPSHIKHACCPSASATFIGDFMFVRAKQHLKPGDEVTISYIEAVASLADRSSELSTRNFSCYCSLCEAEREEPKGSATKRAAILTEFGKKFKLGQSDDLTVITSIINGIKEAYKPSAKIQQMLYLPYTALGAVYLSRDQRRKAAEAFVLALKSLGFTQAHEDYVLKGTGIFPRDILLTLAPMTAIHVYNYYWHAEEFDLAEKWFRIAKGLDKILHGGDELVFRTLYNSFLNVV